MQANGSEKWKIRNKTDNTNTFEILNGDGDGIKIEDDGDLDVRTGDILFSTSGKGICLGVTSNTDANTLDDFEEGTFTPAYAWDSYTNHAQTCLNEALGCLEIGCFADRTWMTTDPYQTPVEDWGEIEILRVDMAD